MENNMLPISTEITDQKILRLRIETVRGNLQGVKETLALGVTVDHPFRIGEWNALMHACSLGHHHIAEYLLKEGANPNFHKELFTPLMAACASNNENEEKLVNCVKHLINYKANVNAMERHRLTPLMFACKQGHVRITKELIDAKADLNIQDSQGWTALFWAVSKGHVDIVELLVRAGANKEERDRSGGTALNLANRKGHREIEEILRYGVRTNTKNGFNSISDSGFTTEDDNSNYSNSIDRNGDIQTVFSNQFNNDISKYITLQDDELEKLKVMKSWLRNDTIELIKELQYQHKTENLPHDDEKDSLSYDAVVKLLAELATQMSNVHWALAFVRCKVQNCPLDLSNENRGTYSTRLRCIARFACFKAEQLFLESKYLHEYIIKMDCPSNLNEGSYEEGQVCIPVDEPKSRSNVLTTVLVASACFIVMIWNTKSIRSFNLFTL